MRTGVHTAAVSLMLTAADESSRSPARSLAPLPPAPRSPRSPTAVAVAVAAGNAILFAWKRRYRESSLYKHRYARRNVTIFQHSVRCAPTSSSSLSTVPVVVSRIDFSVRTLPRDHRTAYLRVHGFDSATGNAIVRRRTAGRGDSRQIDRLSFSRGPARKFPA